jgi:serine protease
MQNPPYMSWRIINIAVAVLLLVLLLQTDVVIAKPDNLDASSAIDDGKENVAKLIVEFKPSSSNNNNYNNLRSFVTRSNNGGGNAHQLLSNKIRSVSNISEKGHLALVDVSNEDKEIVIHELMKDDNVLLVEEDFEIHKSPAIEEQVEDQQQSAGNLRTSLEEVQQYGIRLIQADEIWSTVSSQPNRFINTPVKICIIDTGYSIDHEDLPKTGVTQTDVGYGSSFIDNDGHGTHCAGVIGAIGGNQRGIVGVNPDANKFSFHIVKALNDEGAGSASAVLRAIQGCIDNGSKIISMSIGGGPNSAIFRNAYERVYNEGVLLVSASGNQGQSVHDYPASYTTVISVGAVDEYGNRADFSNYSDQLELMAPGARIKSTYVNGAYRFLSGTSMATPYVAGAFALVWGYFPNCSNNQMRNVFARTARRISQDPNGCDEKNGYGIIQTKAAFDALIQFGCEFGGEDSIPKSLDAVGGCQQILSLSAKMHPPTKRPTKNPTEQPTSASASPPNSFTIPFITWSPTNPSSSLGDRVSDEPAICLQLEYEIQTDEYANETSWEVKKEPSGEVIGSGPSAKTSYNENSLYRGNATNDCLQPGTYTFVISDVFGDGISSPGYYKVSLDGVVLAANSDFGKEEITTFTVGTNSLLTEIRSGWKILVAEGFHDKFGKVFSPGGNNVRWTSERFGRLGLVMMHSGRDTPLKSSFVSQKIVLDAPYKDVKLVISFYANGHMTGEGDGFCFDYASNLASVWNEAKCWRTGQDFETQQWYDQEQIQFSLNSDDTLDFIQIRFRGDSDDSMDRIFLDKVDLLLM